MRIPPMWVAAVTAAGIAPAGPVIGQEIPHATVVDPAHYTVELENEHVRVVRIRYRPGESSPMHSHLPGAYIFLTDGHGRFHLPDGTAAENQWRQGRVSWTGYDAHAVVNAGDRPFEIVVVEPKSAAAAASPQFSQAEYWTCPAENRKALAQAVDSIWGPLFDELVSEGKLASWSALEPTSAREYDPAANWASRATPARWDWVFTWQAESAQRFDAAWTEMVARLRERFPDDPRPSRFCDGLTIVRYEARNGGARGGARAVDPTAEVLALTDSVFAAASRLDIAGTLARYADHPHADQGRLRSVRELRGIYGPIYEDARELVFNRDAGVVHTLGPEAAVVVTEGRFRSVSGDGEELIGRAAWTFVWKSDGDEWRLVHSHQSLAPAND